MRCPSFFAMFAVVSILAALPACSAGDLERQAGFSSFADNAAPLLNASAAPSAATSTAPVLDLPVYVLADSPSVTIGGSGSQPDYLLTETVAALRLINGRIVIGDSNRRELRYYDDEGEFVRKAGGGEPGPGRLERLTSLVRTADGGVAAWDKFLRRLTYYSARGEILATVPVPLEGLAAPSFPSSSKFYVLPGDVLPLNGGRVAAIMTGEPNPLQIPSGPVLLQDTLPVFLADQNGGEWSEIEGGPYAGTVWYFFNRRGRIYPDSYAGKLEYAVGDSVFYLASTLSPVIRRVSAATGQATPFVTLPVAPRPITEADRESLRQRIVEHDSEEAFKAMAIPEELPLFSDLRVSREGDLWVQLFRSGTDTTSTWIMYDAHGEAFGTVTTPVRLRVTDVGRDYVLGVTLGKQAEETVQLYQISHE